MAGAYPYLMTVRIRPEMETLPAYKAGQRPEPREDLERVYKISSNETHYPPLPSVVDAISRAALQTHRYPDPFSTRLVEAISNRFGVPASNIAVGTGSVAVCNYIINSVVGPGDEVIYAWRSFEAYPIWVQIAGGISVQVPLDERLRHDLDAMLNAITDRTRLIFVCNPNNPTGQVVHHDELVAFLERVPSHILVVIDEAYTEFVRDPDVPNGIELYRKFPNVAVLRTFSKAYGLAALRVGFAIAHDDVASAFRKTATPFGVSTIAEEAAIASLAAEDELFARVDAIVAERDRVRDALLAQGWRVEQTEANFIWLALADATLEFAAACEEAGITVRPFAGDGVRITIAEPEANDRVIEVCRDFLPSFSGHH